MIQAVQDERAAMLQVVADREAAPLRLLAEREETMRVAQNERDAAL